ncbi:MAG: methyltransferase domain-containing protein [Bacteroidota bacterium]
MIDVDNTEAQNTYWSQRYTDQRTGWDIGSPSPPLKDYVDQLSSKDLSILIPGAGNSYEAEYLFREGFGKVHVLDIAAPPLQALQQRVPDFPSNQILQGNFFEHVGQYDLILEQTFFCSFPPHPINRQAYAQKMHELLKPGGKLVGLWFDFPLTGDTEKRPFGGDKEEYLGYFSPLFEVKVFEKCYNSIKPRLGNELFGIFEKK